MSALNQAFSSSLSSLNWLGSQELPRLENGNVLAKGAFIGGGGGHAGSDNRRLAAGASTVTAATAAAAVPLSLTASPPQPPSLRYSRLLGSVEAALCCGGLLHTTPGGGGGGGRRHRSGRPSIVLLAYSSFAFLVTALNTVRSAVTLFGAPAAARAAAAEAAAMPGGSWTIVERALVFVWYATGTLTAIAFIASSARRRGVRRFRRTVDDTLEALSSAVASIESDGASDIRPTLAAHWLAPPECVLLVTAVTGCTVAACVGAGLALLDSEEHARSWSWLTVLFVDSSSAAVVWVGRSVTFLATVYCSIACLWAPAYAALLGRLVGRLHGELARRWARSLKRGSSSAAAAVGVARVAEAAEIGEQRRMHGRLSALAAQLDGELIGWLLGLHQLCALLTVCFAAYALWQRRPTAATASSLPVQQAVVLGGALVLAPLKMLVEAFLVADVRSEAMKSADVAFQFVGDRMDSAIKAHLLRAQLRDTKGFTACGWYRIERSTIVKILAFFALAAIMLVVSDGVGSS